MHPRFTGYPACFEILSRESRQARAINSSICKHLANVSDLFSLCLLLLLSDNLGCHIIETAEIRDVAELRFIAARLLELEWVDLQHLDPIPYTLDPKP
jgi:hypothetical protein